MQGSSASNQAESAFLEEEWLQEHSSVPHSFPGYEILFHPQKPENLQW